MVVLVQELCEGRPGRASGTKPRLPFLLRAGAKWGGEEDGGWQPYHTVKCVLLHVDLIKFVGSDEDTVIGEVDTAAGLRGLYLLR